jgi:ribosome-binding protein aMBF1 (putative translation factor)
MPAEGLERFQVARVSVRTREQLVLTERAGNTRKERAKLSPGTQSPPYAKEYPGGTCGAVDDLRPQIIASRILARRHELGISQERLAELIGKNRRDLRRWEHGDHTPSWPNLLLLAEHLDCSPAWLAGMSDTRSPFVEELAS